MSWPNIRLIFLRELRDQLRDRRTLFMILVLPILLYPTIGIGMLQFVARFAEQPRQIVVLGREHLPPDPPLIEKDQFVAELFDVPDEAGQLRIVSSVDALQALRQLELGQVQVILVVPRDITEQIESGQGFQWQTKYNSADEKSRIAYLRLKEALDNWKQQIIQDRIASRSLPPDFANPFVLSPQDIATPQQVSGGLVWGKLLPFLLVVMSLTGAFYPAVDLCAGEKERGTMETLLISPAGRSEIVIGKYFTICLFSVVTATLNLASMAATGWVVARQLESTMPDNLSLTMLSLPGVMATCWIMLLLIPMAAFFSALGIALAAFARSTKEGQYYLTPLFIVTMPLVLVTLAPGTELDGFYSIVPVTGVALLLKTLIQGHYDRALEYFLPVMLPTMLYAVLALRWAIDQFNREEVLFREAERTDVRLWARHLIRDKGAFPSGAEALFCYGVMLLLVWFLSSLLQSPTTALDVEGRQWRLQRSLLVMQIAFVATPAVIMAIMLTRRPRQTLLLTVPPLKLLGVGLLLAIVLHPIVVEAGQRINNGLPPQPKFVEEQIRDLLGGPLWWQLLLIAALPAACEELAFRGFILSGLLHRMSAFTAIIVSGFLFGFFHMNPQQLLTATVLGWVLGIIATRSGSLLPGMVFHFLNNAMAVLMANLQGHLELCAETGRDPGILRTAFDILYRQPAPDSFVFQAPYSVTVLVICGLVLTLLLTWLIKQPSRSPVQLNEAAVPESDAVVEGRRGGDGFGLTRLAPPTLNPLARDPRDATA